MKLGYWDIGPLKLGYLGYPPYTPLLPITVNQLNFAAVKFRGLPISLYFAYFNFAFWYLRTKYLSDYGPIFKI